MQQNIKTISSQLQSIENKLAASTVLSNPEVLNEEGLPVTEIREELDDEDNVICEPLTLSSDCTSKLSLASSTLIPGEAVSDIVKRIESSGNDGRADLIAQDSGSETQPAQAENGRATKSSLKKEPVANDPRSPAKGALGTAPMPKESASLTSTAKPYRPERRVTFSADVRDEAPPSMPPDDTPEETALRREMLRYNMEEIGAVVAEMQLDDDDDDKSLSDHDSRVEYESALSEDDEEGSMTDDGESGEEDEDQYGRTTTRVLDSDYVAQMRELEKKLNATALFNAGPESTSAADRGLDREQAELKSPCTENVKSDQSKSQAGKTVTKGVRFAPELDIQEDSEPITRTEVGSRQPPVARNILERNSDPGSSRLPSSEPATKKKVSRFKAARSQANSTDISSPITGTNQPNPPPQIQSTTPNPPRNQIHSDRIIERHPSSDPALPPPAPNANEDGDEDFDTTRLQQDIRREYHHLRNRQIQREGGFLAAREEDSAEVPLTPEEGGAPKVSRFKAARLGRQQSK